MSAVRRLAAVPALAAVAAAGVGWLYVLFRLGVLRAGPAVPDVLALQRLAGGDAQPVARVVAAWLPTGVAAGAVLLALGHRRRTARAALAFAVTAVVLLACGGLADAVTASQRLAAQLGDQPRHLAPWLAAALVATGAALPAGAPR